VKIVTVLGARPQFIKAATISRVVQKDSAIKEIIIHTGQHYDQNMSDIFFDEMQIPKPDHFLQITSKFHGEMTGKMMEGIEKILLHEKPDVVLVYGDTNSTLAGALAAGKLHIPIAHVEAGLRSYNRKMPEEINRVLTDHLSEWLFAPTDSAVENLSKEGVDSQKVYHVGDVMYDAIQFYQKISEQQSSIVSQLGLKPGDFILVTIHRAENTNDTGRMEEILTQLNSLAKDRVVVFPMHPRTRHMLGDHSLIKNIKVVDPVGYFDMIALQRASRLIVTDSGGVQKEAFIHGKYCITVREETEWIELVEAGFNFLATPLNKITDLVNTLWNKPLNPGDFKPYGDGHSAEKIIKTIRAAFK
jgi:UDP-GlcNAc3NAcA epimerase